MDSDTSTLDHTKILLNVGSSPADDTRVDPRFLQPPWRMVRVDIDPTVEPDIVASITCMSAVKDSSVDAIWSRHNLEHLYHHEVPLALKEFYRVLRIAGVAMIFLPDLQRVAEHLADGRLEEPLYRSPAGDICAIDMLYGHRESIRRGNHFMSHRTGFTSHTLRIKLAQAGFSKVQTQRQGFQLMATAQK